MTPGSGKATTRRKVNAIDQYQIMADAILGKDNQVFLETILDTLPVGVTLQTLDGRYLFANRTASWMHGYTPEEFTQPDFHRELIIAPQDIQLINDAVKTLVKNRNIKNLRFDALKKDGTGFRKETSAGLICDANNEPYGILVISRDVTEEERIQKSESEERVLAEALVSSAALISSSLKLDDVLDRILELAERVVPHDSSNIMLIEDEVVHVVRARGYKTRELHDFTMQVSTRVKDFSSMAQMVIDGLPLAIPDTRKYPGWYSAPDFRWILSYVGAPLRFQGRVIGVINLDSGTPDFFCQDDANRLQAFADMAASAVANANLYEASRIQADESAALFRAATALLRATGDIKSLADQITKTVHQDFSSAHVAVLLMDEFAGKLIQVSQSGYPADQTHSYNLDNMQGLAMAAIKEKKPVYVGDVNSDPRYIRDSELTRSEFDIPFIIGKKIIGVLNLESPKVNGFDEKARRILLTYAERASIALENAQLVDRLQQHDFQMDLINRLTQISLKTGNLKQMLIDQVEIIFNSLKPDGFLISFSDPAIRKIITGYAIAGDPEINRRVNEMIQQPEYSLQFASHPERIETDESKKQPLSGKHPDNPFNSYLVHSLSADGVRIGSASFGYFSKHMFTEKETAFFKHIIDQIALALAKNLSIQKTDNRAREAINLRNATATLTSTLDLQEVFERILKAAVEAIPTAQNGLLFQLDHKKKDFYVRAQYGFNNPEIYKIRLNNHEGMAGLIASEKKARLFNNVTAEKFYDKQSLKHSIISHKSWIVAPLVLEDKIIGVIELCAPNSHEFDEHDLNILVSFADTVAAAIKNAQLHAEVQQVALTDLLTGLYNRRAFEEIGQREIHRSIRTSAPLSLLLIDLDYLKQVNDEFGHSTGDRLICMTADCCRSVFRQIDLITRYGGDEFAILLPDTPLDHAREAAERFRRTLRIDPLKIKDREIHLSASIGVACFSRDIQTIQQLFELADKALYQAKNSGRDTIYIKQE